MDNERKEAENIAERVESEIRRVLVKYDVSAVFTFALKVHDDAALARTCVHANNFPVFVALAHESGKELTKMMLDPNIV